MIEKPVTIKEIASILNISASTVSRALHNVPSIGLTTRLKVNNLAKQLNYEPNQIAISFQKGKTRTIGVILPELSEPFFSMAVSAIEEAAHRRNYTVFLAQSHDDEQAEKKLVEKMKNQRVDGLLVSVSKNTSTFEHFNTLKKYNIPVVFFDRIPAIQNIHYVGCNIETGTIEAVNYLLRKGHRIIGMINGPKVLVASVERYEGYNKAMIRNRLKPDPVLVVECDLTQESTNVALDKLLSGKRKPTAIVTFNDYVALFAIKHAQKLRIGNNSELEFVSYGNLPLINYMEHAPIASIEQFPYSQGHKATEVLLDLLNQKNTDLQRPAAYYRITIESQLIEKKKDERKRD